MLSFTKLTVAAATVGLLNRYQRPSKVSGNKVLALEHRDLSEVLEDDYYVPEKSWNCNWDNRGSSHGRRTVNCFLLVPIKKPSSGTKKSLEASMKNYQKDIDLLAGYLSEIEEMQKLEWIHCANDPVTESFYSSIKTLVSYIGRVEDKSKGGDRSYTVIKTADTSQGWLHDPNPVYVKKHGNLASCMKRYENVFSTHVTRTYAKDDDNVKDQPCPGQAWNCAKLFICSGEFAAYATARALQVPKYVFGHLKPKEGSLTWISISPDGNVKVKQFGDQSYMKKRLGSHAL